MGNPEDEELRRLVIASGLTVEPPPFHSDETATRGTIVYPKPKGSDTAPMPPPDLTDFQRRFPITEFPLNCVLVEGFGNVYIRMTSKAGPESIITPDLLSEHPEASGALFGPFERARYNPPSDQKDQNAFSAWETEAKRLGFTLFPYDDDSGNTQKTPIGHGFRAFALTDALSDRMNAQLHLAGLDEISRMKLNMTLEKIRRGVNSHIGLNSSKHKFFD